jgi:hypothetical protein
VWDRLQAALGNLSGSLTEVDLALRDKEVADWFFINTDKHTMTKYLDNIESAIPRLRSRLNVGTYKDNRTEKEVIVTDNLLN